ncbi:CRTAC1 family protein [Jannaschia sp. M317]|uniref:CRTAC1 family protein n=1 Tax=Jannaschia sp. M317 TaxID=2867011 RepID=UPI0021A7B434|nr:CRTAC1 family protein [Jannaschia sp. M317]
MRQMQALTFMTLSLFGPGLALADAPRFLDRSTGLPVQHVYSGGWDHFVGGGVALLDCDGDSRPDLFVAGGTSEAVLLRNATGADDTIRFETVPVPALTAVTGAYPLDLDGDAITDLMVLRKGPNVLLRGLGACAFEDATDAVTLPAGDSWSTAFTASWETGQTLPTLAIGNYVDTANPDGPFEACDVNHLIRPDGPRYGPAVALSPGFCTLSALFTDWRRDGTPMLRLSNDRHYYVRGGYEQMWTLDPLRELTEADGWDRVQLWGMGIASRDLTGDGLPEVMLTSMGDQLLMTNDGTGFDAVPYAMGTTAQRPFVGDDGRPSTGWHAEFGDVDNDGRADLFIAKGNVDQMPGMAMADPNNLLMQQADGTFAETGDVAGLASTERSRGAGLADLNGDGRLDVIVVNRRAPMQVWQNATEGTGHWIALDPRLPAGNRFAIGAFVEVRTPSGVQTQERTVGGGHVSGSLLPLHFGLGTASEAEVRVIWPGGQIGPWHRLEAGRTHTIAPG